MKTMVCRKVMFSGTRTYFYNAEVTNVASAMTNVTAAPIPKAVFTLLETPKNGQIPRNCTKMILFTSTAPIIINIYSIISIFSGLFS